jgi:hypothetical protein
MSRLAPLALFCLALLRASAEEVGEAGVTARMELAGNRAIASADLRAALLGDLDWLLASHPRAPRERMAVVASERIGAGYQASGFPHPAVTASIVGGRLRVEIVEGPRFRCGAVVVSGATAIPPATVAAWLTTAQPKARAWTASEQQAAQAGEPEARAGEPQVGIKATGSRRPLPTELDDPLWRAGELADFTPAFAQRLAGQVRAGYARAGRLAAVVAAAVAEIPDGSAELRVAISDEGAVARVAEVTIDGLERTPRAEVERVLGLAPDQALDQDSTARLEQALSDCGRFRFQQVKLEPTADRTRWRVAVVVQESGNIPPLPQPLSPEAQALLTARAWLLADLHDGPEDLVLTTSRPGTAISLVLSPRNGLLIDYDVTPDGGARRFGGLVIGTEAYEVVSGNAGRGVRGTLATRFGVTVSLVNTRSVERAKPTNRDPLSFTFELPFTAKHAGDSGPAFASTITIAPAALLTVAYADDVHWRVADGRLALADAPADGPAFDAASGRPLPFAHGDDKGNHLIAAFVVDAFAKHRAAFAARHAGVAWTSEPVAPLAAIIALLLDEVREALPVIAGADAVHAGALGELGGFLALADAAGADGLLPRGEAWLRASLADLWTRDAFRIPPSPGFQPNIQAMGAILLAKANGLLAGDLPADSWPLALLRGAAGALIGNTALINPDLRVLTGEDGCGPLGCLALAAAVRLVNPAGARYFAKLGGERLGEAHLLRDARLFRPWAGRILAQLAGLPPEGKLWDLLPAGQRAAIRELLATLRRPAADAQEEAKRFDDACRVLWANGLRERVAAWLAALAAEDAAPIP